MAVGQVDNDDTLSACRRVHVCVSAGRRCPLGSLVRACVREAEAEMRAPESVWARECEIEDGRVQERVMLRLDTGGGVHHRG
jgi:hypothetical protein